MDLRGKPLSQKEREELDHALQHYEWALAEYQRQLKAGGDYAELQRFQASVIMPALAECDRLAAPIRDEDKRLVEELRQCHEEAMAASRELRNPSKSILSKDYEKLAGKVKALQAKCREVRLALTAYRKKETP